MVHKYFHTKPERVASCLCMVIGSVLAVAAYGKLFYPSEMMPVLDRCVSGFEILFVPAVFYLRRHWQVWSVAAVIFAGWCGYALYWFCLKLPCECMGEMLSIPTALTLSLDVFFVASSLFVSKLLGASDEWIYFYILAILFASLVGYAFADWIYAFIIVRM